MSAQVFFSEEVAAAIKGKAPLDQLEIIRNLVDEADAAKQAGSGPPLDDINAARRLYIRIAGELYRARNAV
ncbi:hypothetical protein ACWTU6_27060 [Mesorhizobium sp. BHbsci]